MGYCQLIIADSLTDESKANNNNNNNESKVSQILDSYGGVSHIAKHTSDCFSSININGQRNECRFPNFDFPSGSVFLGGKTIAVSI